MCCFSNFKIVKWKTYLRCLSCWWFLWCLYQLLSFLGDAWIDCTCNWVCNVTLCLFFYFYPFIYSFFNSFFFIIFFILLFFLFFYFFFIFMVYHSFKSIQMKDIFAVYLVLLFLWTASTFFSLTPGCDQVSCDPFVLCVGMMVHF